MKGRKITLEFIWFLIFFLLISSVTTVSILLYVNVDRNTDGNKWIVAASLAGNILFGAVLFTIINSIRWRLSSEKHVNDILEATNLIAKGNFNINVKINKKREYYTEYDYIIENINIMAAELRKNEVLKEDFISNFSHEIKTPLQIIKNYITLLQDKNISEDEKKDYLNN
ncbi:MAG: hypothetical protein K6A63_08605, partial [Acholeplasmatales bacterium]|nr:hypothetical protein [Acholeplasmatales bacterium]